MIDHDLYIDKEAHYDQYFAVIMNFYDALSGAVQEENAEMVQPPLQHEEVPV